MLAARGCSGEHIASDSGWGTAGAVVTARVSQTLLRGAAIRPALLGFRVVVGVTEVAEGEFTEDWVKTTAVDQTLDPLRGPRFDRCEAFGAAGARRLSVGPAGARARRCRGTPGHPEQAPARPRAR